ncbi:MAG: TonB family protein [Acidobacteriota bacterium]|nr:TonB family protein [Acidobacteriota bacterium]
MRQPVLVVDFDQRSLAAARKRLEDAGFACRCAGSAPELDAQLQAGTPPVVVLDPMLPGKDGFKLCRELKRKQNGAPVVIIFSRIFKGQRYRAMARDAGADLFLERPRDDHRLVEEIRQRLEAHQEDPSLLDPRTAARVPGSSTDADPALADITDDEIDGALQRALGFALPDDAASSPDPAPATPTADAVAEVAAAAESIPPATGPVEQAEGRVDAADLWASLDRLELEVAEELAPTRPQLTASVMSTPSKPAVAPPGPARTLDSPMAFGPAEELESAAPPTVTPELVDLPSTGVPDGPIADSQAIESVVDSVIAFAPTAETGPVAPGDDDANEAPPAEVDGFEAVGQAPEPTGATSAEPGAVDAAADDAPPPSVPEPLRGMDAGTAELLSTLEELESSLPPDYEAGMTGESAWTGTGSLGGLSGTAGEPERAPLPSREEEPSLEDLLDQLAADGPDRPAPAAAEAPDTEEPARAAGASPTGAMMEDPPSRLASGVMLLSFAIGIVLTGAVGGFFLSRRPAPPVQRALMPITRTHTGDGRVPMMKSPAEAPPRTQAMRRVPESVEEPPPVARPVAPPPTPRPREAAAVGPVAPEKKIELARARPAPPRPPQPAVARAETPKPAAPPVATSPPPPLPQAPRRDPVPAAKTADARQPPPQPRPAASTTPPGDRPQPSARLETPPEPPAAPDPLEPPAPLVRLGDLDYPLRLLEAPKPELTPEAREAEVQGRVFLSVLVDPNGNVKDARIMIEPGYGLGRAAAEAVKHWRYSPPRNKGRRARVWKTEVVEFQLPQ